MSRPSHREHRRPATRRLPPPRPRSAWELEHNAFTVEGQIEGLSRFMGGMARATGWRRTAARVMGAVLLASFLLPLASGCLAERW